MLEKERGNGKILKISLFAIGVNDKHLEFVMATMIKVASYRHYGVRSK